MRYYVACLHSDPRDNTDLPEGYCLTPSQLSRVAAQAGGAPFTYEHQGVHEAVSIIGQKNVTPAAMHETLGNLAKTDAKKAVIGNVLSAFLGKDNALWCTLILDEERYPRIDNLIVSGRVRGVSLTHVPSTLAAVEVALTSDPARKNAFIRHDLVISYRLDKHVLFNTHRQPRPARHSILMRQTRAAFNTPRILMRPPPSARLAIVY